jgi:hypothetical protein
MNTDNIETILRRSGIYFGIFLVASLALFIKFHSDKHLALDGVGYFYQILESQNFANVAWSRRFTEYLTEWPLVLAVRSGVTDIPLLIDIFSLGIYLPYLISFLLCCYAARDEDSSFLWFPLAGYIAFNTLSDYDLIADHHVMAVMTWPILLMLLKTRAMTWSEGAVLWILLILYSRMYETVVLTAGLLFIVALIRAFCFPEKREKIILGIVLMLLTVAITIAIIYIISPRDPINRGSFLDSIWVNKRNWEAVATCGFLAIFSLGWIIPENWVRLRRALFLTAVLPIVYYAFLRLTTDYAMTAYISFSSRTLSAIVLPGLIVLAVIVVIGKRKLTRTSKSVFLLVFLVMTGFNLSDLRHWNDVKREISRAIESEEMFLSIDDTVLSNSHYRWSWNNSLLSLVWAGDCVNTIVLNSLGEEGPIEPREKLVLKRYLKYDAKFRSIDPDIETCRESY